MLTDNHGRIVNYLRLAVTDKCNLRCGYCMPSTGLDWLPKKDILSYEEMIVLLRICHSLGISKLRFTGGEPFVRKDFVGLLEEVCSRNWFDKISITTNGVLTSAHIPTLKKLNINSVNLSLDTINRERFIQLTHRDELNAVMDTFHGLIEEKIKVRVNAVIMENQNEEDMFGLASLASTYPVDVRFIEEMPFNGMSERHAIKWSAKNIVHELTSYFPGMSMTESEPNSTSVNYAVPGFKGSIGVIAAYTRNFCGTCNRMRITPNGTMKTCLYDGGVLNLRDLIRSGISDEDISVHITNAIQKRFISGIEAAKHRSGAEARESMATIGG